MKTVLNKLLKYDLQMPNYIQKNFGTDIIYNTPKAQEYYTQLNVDNFILTITIFFTFVITKI